MHALADCVPVQCAIKDLRLYAISFYLSRDTRFVLLSAYAYMPYTCRFFDFRVRRFDNKLQVAFDRVRCWFFQVLLTSQLGR